MSVDATPPPASPTCCASSCSACVRPGCDGPTCDFPITQEQLADATGLTSIHTNRTLQALRKQGLITLSRSKLTVLDWDRLSQVGDFTEGYLHHSAAGLDLDLDLAAEEAR